MANKNRIKGKNFEGSIYQDVNILSPGIPLRMYKSDPQMIQIFMDEIAAAVTESSDAHVSKWILYGGKAELCLEPNPVSLFEKEKKIGTLIDQDEKQIFEEWIKEAIKKEDVGVVLAEFRADGAVNLNQLKMNPDHWVRKCEFGVMKTKMEDNVYKILESTVYYGNLFLTSCMKKTQEGFPVISTINADKGFRPVFIKRDSNDIEINLKFHPSSWNDLKWYSMMRAQLSKPATVFFRFADDQFYIFRKTIQPESWDEKGIDYEEILKFIDDIEMIQDKYQVIIKVNERFDERQCEFIKLLSASLKEELTEYRWDKDWFLIRPSGAHLENLIQREKDEEFCFTYQERVSCDFSSITFSDYWCTNIIESARIANYDEVQRAYSANEYPIIFKLEPGKNNKWYRILELPENN